MRPSPITTRVPSRHRAPPPFHLLEFTLAALLSAALLAALLTLTRAYFGLERWFWLDETITVLIARDPSPLHALRSLTAGLDSNLPGLYLLLRLLKFLGLPMTELPLRSLTLFALWSCLLGLYTLLRLSFDRLTAAAATFPILLAPALIDQTFEIRFYVIWTALCIWLTLALAHLRLSKKCFTPWHLAALILTSSIMLIHYFGIITLALMLACDWYADPRSIKRKLTSRWPLFVGLLPGFIIPWFYFHQRHSLGSSTWEDPNTLQATFLLLQEAFQFNTLAILAAVAVFLWLTNRYFPRKIPLLKLRRVPLKHLHLLAPLAGLLAWPFLLALLSWTFQPLLVPRYTLPALGGVSLLIALLIYRFSKPLLTAILLLSVPFAIGQFTSITRESMELIYSISHIGYLIESQPTSEPIICEARNELYPLLLYYPELQSRLYYLDFEPAEESSATLPRSLNFMLFERDAQRNVARHYPVFQSWPKSKLPQLQSFIFVPTGSIAGLNRHRIIARFAGWQITPIADRLCHVYKPIPTLPRQ